MQGSSFTPTAAASTDVLLLRHAATRWNAQGRRLGWIDQPLSADGRRSAGAWTPEPRVEFAAVLASDLRRALQTAQIIATALGVSEIAPLAGLREQDEGDWTGMTKEQIKRRWPQRARERPRRPIGGEAPETVLERVLRTLGEIAEEHAGCRVLAVTHNGVIHALERALGLPTPAVAHLEGRWLHVLAPRLGEGDDGLARLRPGELTCGRRARAGGAQVEMASAR